MKKKKKIMIMKKKKKKKKNGFRCLGKRATLATINFSIQLVISN